MPVRGLRFWAGISAALHGVLLLLVLLDLATRRIPEPEDAGIAVELIAALPPQQAQGERPAPAPAPPAAVPPPPRPEPPAAELRPAPAVLPPPPPPPPAPAPAPSPRAEPVPRPLPPPPAPSPEPSPTPPRPQVAQAPTPPQQQTATAPPAAARPEPPLPLPPPPVPPPPEPSRQAGTGQTPPVQRPQERSASVLNTLERLQQQRQQEAPRARPAQPQGAPQPGGGAPTGAAQLTAGEMRNLADQIGECWSVDGGAPDIAQIVVELRVRLDGTGTVRNVVPATGIPADPRARAVYESARRALLAPQCNPLKVPAAKLASLEVATFRFSPRGLVR